MNFDLATHECSEVIPKAPRRKVFGRGTLFLVGGVTLYLLAPAVIEVVSSWDRVSQLDARWFVAVGLAQVPVFILTMLVQRIALRTNRWGPVVTSLMAGNAAGRMMPGGSGAAAAVQFKLLRDAGVETAHASVGLATAAALQIGAVLILPIVALPALLINSSTPSGVLPMAALSVSMFVVLTVSAAVVFLTNRPLRGLGNLIDRVLGRLPGNRQAGAPTASRMLATRDSLRVEFGPNLTLVVYLALGRVLFEYLGLVLALKALGSEVGPVLLVAVFSGATMLAMIPLTPGGLGFVETGLTGGLALLGIPPATAVSAALLYRLFSYWLPIPIGLVAGVAHRVLYPPGDEPGKRQAGKRQVDGPELAAD